MTLATLATLDVDGVGSTLDVVRLRIDDAIGGIYGAEVTVAQLPELDLDAAIGAKTELSIAGGPRIAGVVEGAAQRPGETIFYLEPKVARARRSRDHRIFLEQDAIAIAKTVLAEHDVEVHDRTAQPPPVQAQQTQCFEDDLAFVTRVLGEEGISWWVEDDGRVAFGDGPVAHEPIEGPELPFGAGEADGLDSEEAVFSLRVDHALCHDQVTLRDYDFTHPKLDLTVDHTDGDGILERFELAGPGRYVNPDEGARCARIRLEQERTTGRRLSAESTCRRLRVGRTFTLNGAPRDDLDGDWLVIAVESELSDVTATTGQRRFTTKLSAIPAATPFRKRPPAAPQLGSLQTGTITGAPGEEIHTDRHGRVRALYRYDRTGEADDSSSTLLRVVHPATSTGFMLPRVGWEALMAFEGRDGDRPYVLGRLDNGQHPPSETLPEHKARSVFGTLTTPGGGSAQKTVFDDSLGSGHLSLAASKNYKESTAKNKTYTVKGNDQHSVGSNHTLTYESKHSLKVDGAQSIAVGGERTVTAKGGMTIEAGSETVGIGGLRYCSIGGDYAYKVGASFTRLVGGIKGEAAIVGQQRQASGAATMAVGGSWGEAGLVSALSVGGVSALACPATTILCRAKWSCDVSAALVETAGSRTDTASSGWYYLAKGKLSATLGATTVNVSNVTVAAKKSLTVNAGGATIEMTPTKITFGGSFNAAGKNVAKKGKVEHE